MAIETLKGVNDLGINGIETTTGAELVGRRIERLLFTEPYGYLGKPEIGSLIPQMLYGPMTEQDALDIVNEIEFLIKNAEPDLDLEEISVQMVPMSTEAAGIAITIKGSAFDSNESVDLQFFKIRERN